MKTPLAILLTLMTSCSLLPHAFSHNNKTNPSKPQNLETRTFGAKTGKELRFEKLKLANYRGDEKVNILIHGRLKIYYNMPNHPWWYWGKKNIRIESEILHNRKDVGSLFFGNFKQAAMPTIDITKYDGTEIELAGIFCKDDIDIREAHYIKFYANSADQKSSRKR